MSRLIRFAHGSESVPMNTNMKTIVQFAKAATFPGGIMSDYKGVHDKQRAESDWQAGWSQRYEIGTGIAFLAGLLCGIVLMWIGVQG